VSLQTFYKYWYQQKRREMHWSLRVLTRDICFAPFSTPNPPSLLTLLLLWPLRHVAQPGEKLVAYPSPSLITFHRLFRPLESTVEIYCNLHRPMWDLRFSRRRVLSLESSGMYSRVVTLKLTDVSQVRLIHRPDDGGSTHLWNVGQLQRDYTALHPRRLLTT
jgi:hypothetical protein